MLSRVEHSRAESDTKPFRKRSSELHVFCLGYGYSAQFVASELLQQGFRVSGTTRSDEKAQLMREAGVTPVIWDGSSTLPDGSLEGITHLLQSIPPDETGDIVMNNCSEQLSQIDTLQWAGYFSTTGVYGNHDGAWVDEETALTPANKRSEHRVLAEQQWLDWGDTTGHAVHIFRLPGIYGPNRSALTRVKEGTANRIAIENQYFSRVHVVDIVNAVQASIRRPRAGAIYNVCDDLPSSAASVVEFAANLLGVDPPPLKTPDEADLSPMARSFYQTSKRVRNDKIKDELRVTLRYPDYKAGLRQIYDDGLY